MPYLTCHIAQEEKVCTKPVFLFYYVRGKYLRDSSVQTQNLFSRHSILSFAACEGEFL